MAEQPTDIFTFLFTDIEGSTRLWEQQPKAMRAALAHHDALLRHAIESSGGHVFKTVGDSVCAAFAIPEAALDAAVTAQRRLQEELPEVRVRMALHTGEAEAVGDDYLGPALNRVARLLPAGHGGQVLLSQAASESLRTSLPSDAHLRPMGVHRLRDIAAREAIFQLVAPPLPDQFPPLNTLDVAFRRGLRRATAIAAGVVVVVGALALVAVSQARVARGQRRVAEERERTTRRVLYASQMKVAQQAEEAGDVSRALQILERLRPEPGQEELRGFEWRHLWLRCQGDARATWDFHEGHVVNDVALSPDGRTVAVADYPNLRLRDAATGREIGLLCSNRQIRAVAFSPDGQTMAGVGNDPLVRLWDVATRRQVAALTGHRAGQSVHAVAFAPSGGLLATAGTDRTVRLWDARRRRPIATLAAETDYHALHCLAFSPDGRLLVVGLANGPIQLWSVSSRRPLAVLKGHSGPVIAVGFSPDGRSLASASRDSMIKLWDLPTRREVATLPGRQGEPRAVGFFPDGRRLATGGQDHTVRIWDLATRQELTALKGHHGDVRSLVITRDGKRMLTGSGDASVKLWDIASPGAATTLLRQGAPVTALALSPTGEVLATGSDDGTIRVWDLASRRRRAVLRGHAAAVRWLRFSPDGRTLASGSLDWTNRLWDLATKRPFASLAESGGIITDAVFSPDGRTLAATVVLSPEGSGRSGRIQIRDAKSGRLLRTVSRMGGAGRSVAFSPDGKALATISEDLGGQLWDLGTGRGRSLGDPVYPPVLFSPDGRLLAAHGDSDDVSGELPVRIWEVASRRRVATLRGISTFGEAMAFSPDGVTLADARGGAIALWSLPTRQGVGFLRGHEGPVSSMAFAPDGRLLASGSGDGTVRLWHAATLPEADPVRLLASTAGGRVKLHWQPVPHALGYNVSGGPSPGGSSELDRLNLHPLTATQFADARSAPVDGQTYRYAVRALFRGPRGRVIEGPSAVVKATPTEMPPGFLGCSINEGPITGSVSLQSPTATQGGRTGEITMRGSGRDLWDTADGCYLYSRPTTGDFTMTVRLMAGPSLTKDWAAGGDSAKAGLMLRETLQAGSRDAYLVVTPRYGMWFQWRPVANDDCGSRHVLDPSRLPMSTTLRLTRRGNTVTAAYSQDGGRTFQPASEPLSFAPPLPPTVYAGLVITSHQTGSLCEARFRDLKIEER